MGLSPISKSRPNRNHNPNPIPHEVVKLIRTRVVMNNNATKIYTSDKSTLFTIILHMVHIFQEPH